MTEVSSHDSLVVALSLSDHATVAAYVGLRTDCRYGRTRCCLPHYGDFLLCWCLVNMRVSSIHNHKVRWRYSRRSIAEFAFPALPPSIRRFPRTTLLCRGVANGRIKAYSLLVHLQERQYCREHGKTQLAGSGFDNTLECWGLTN